MAERWTNTYTTNFQHHQPLKASSPTCRLLQKPPLSIPVKRDAFRGKRLRKQSDPLHGSTEKIQETRVDRSLSSIANSSGRQLDGSLDIKPKFDKGTSFDELSWNIIDREIFEWQYVCQTGRPYWWSPESRSNRLRKLQPRSLYESNPSNWIKEVIDEHLKPSYHFQRRSVSEAHLTDPAGPVDDLAHMIAVQLLGACFTMPPGQAIGIPPPNYVASDCPTSNSTIIPDPRMTSSLRMHTHFLYSACFGHQACNSSPIQLWMYDGHSPNTSPRLAPDIKPRFKDSNVLHEIAQLPAADHSASNWTFTSSSRRVSRDEHVLPENAP